MTALMRQIGNTVVGGVLGRHCVEHANRRVARIHTAIDNQGIALLELADCRQRFRADDSVDRQRYGTCTFSHDVEEELNGPDVLPVVAPAFSYGKSDIIHENILLPRGLLLLSGQKPSNCFKELALTNSI